MNKRIILIVAIILIIVAATIGIIYIASNDKEEQDIASTDAIKFKQEYEALNGQKKSDGVSEHMSIDIESDNPIKYIDEDEVINILNNGTGVIYFGMPDCPWCRNAIPVLIDAAKERGLNDIYYFNPKQIRQDNTEKYQQIVEKLKDYLQIDTTTQDEENPDFNVNKKRVYVPDVFFVKDGKVIGHNFKTVDSHKDPTIRLNDEQYSQLRTIYDGYIQQMQNEVCNDSGC